MTTLYDITNWPKLGFNKTEYPLIGTVDAAPKSGECWMSLASSSRLAS